MDRKQKELSQRDHLPPGQYFGDVCTRRECTGTLLAELRHNHARRLPAHSHERAFFCMLLNGSYREVFAGRTFEYKPFTVLFHRDEITHRDEIGKVGARFFMVEIAAGLIERLREHSPVPDVMVGARGHDLSTLAARLFREHAQPAPASPLVLEGLILEMLGAVARDRYAGERRHPVWLERAVELLHEEFDQSLTVTDIAARVGVHPFHLSRVFRRFHRLSVGEYVNRLRVEFACRQLCEADIKLSDVALRAGFSDQSHFSRVFKETTGMTPGMFRAAGATREGISKPRRSLDD